MSNFLTPNPNWRTINVKNIEIAEFIGAGAQGRVFKATYANERLALKKIPINTRHDQIVLERELQILSGLDHQNIIKFHGAGIYYNDSSGKETVLYQLLELASLGTLFSVIHKPKAEQLQLNPIGYLYWWLQDIINGLNYLHKQNPRIIHRDVKTENILVAAGVEAVDSEANSQGEQYDTYYCKLADFGSSKKN